MEKKTNDGGEGLNFSVTLTLTENVPTMMQKKMMHCCRDCVGDGDENLHPSLTWTSSAIAVLQSKQLWR
jgi:hypothetical protein